MPSAAHSAIVDDHRLREITTCVTRGQGLRADARFVAAIVLVGIIAGLGGMCLALLLHAIQHAAYGYDLGAVVSPESFLQGVTAASPARRVAALTLCGAVAGVGWWAVYRFGRPLVSVKAAVGETAPGPPMPAVATTAHALLQIITVALGSPLGREVAPREIGALLATRISSRLALSADETRLVIACGAGAGLAAVYNVPLGGAVFVLEVLLDTLKPRIVAASLTVSVIASTIAWIGLGDVAQYSVPPLHIDKYLVVASVLTGPMFGVAAYAFRVVARKAVTHAAHGWRRIPWSLAVFLVIGLLATQFPQLPGNGKGPSQLGFDGAIGGGLALELLFLKLVAVVASLYAGAAGGVLTPSLTLGALMATALCHVWTPVVPGFSSAGFAIVGGAAFLAASMNMPLTAILLTLEFTRVSHDFCVPIFLAVAGSIAALRLCAGLGPQTSSSGGRQSPGFLPGRRP
ncbi:MAG: chloride channel protein [Acetobacteraceae bacterium]|nr:chloride channel protein [Acetobacteraceae bacterium]